MFEIKKNKYEHVDMYVNDYINKIEKIICQTTRTILRDQISPRWFTYKLMLYILTIYKMSLSIFEERRYIEVNARLRAEKKGLIVPRALSGAYVWGGIRMNGDPFAEGNEYLFFSIYICEDL